MREEHGIQRNEVWWYTEQLARWQRASPTRVQAQALSRLTQQLTAQPGAGGGVAVRHHGKIRAKDEGEWALEYLLEKRRL